MNAPIYKKAFHLQIDYKTWISVYFIQYILFKHYDW